VTREKPVEGYTIGFGGWVRYQANRLPFPVFLRIRESRDGRLEIGELYIGDGERITGDLLRRLDLNRIESYFNGEVAEFLRSQLKLVGPDLRRLIGYYSTVFSFTGELNWVQRSFLAQYEREDNSEPQAPEQTLTEPFRAIEYVIDATLDIPISRPWPDDFYRRVADLYRRLVGVVRAPAGVIADANRVPVKRVHEWVKVARDRGFLLPGRQGKAG